MEQVKKIGISFLYTICFIVGLTFIFSIFNYFNIIGDSFFKFIKILIPIISIFIGGFLIGKKSTSKGWLEGIKYGFIIIALMFLISIIFFRSEFNIRIILYYLILLLTSTTSSMIGISFKKS